METVDLSLRGRFRLRSLSFDRHLPTNDARSALDTSPPSGYLPHLVLDYTDDDSVALNVGFYDMANAGGRLFGTLLSGLVFQFAGFQGCLWGSAALVLPAAVLSLSLPRGHAVLLAARMSELVNGHPVAYAHLTGDQAWQPASCYISSFIRD